MKNKSIICAILLATTAASGVARAQSASEAANNAGAADEIVVTAQKRSEKISDVPLSITAASGEQLAKRGITDPTGLERIVPGFTYQKSTFGVPVFTIRGIGLYSTSAGVSPTVTVYTDQVPLPYLAMTAGAGFDLERLEALKGPQGILFGQNSTGGAINYIAAKPTRDPSMGFSLTYGRFNEIDGEAYVSGPITSNLTARIAARHEYRDPWQFSETRPNDRLGKRDFSQARLLLDWKPTDTVSLELNVIGWLDRSDTQAAQFDGFAAARTPGYPESIVAIGTRAPAPRDVRVADWDAGANLQRDDRFYQISLRGDAELSDTLTLTSITAYSDLRMLAPNDTDGTDFNNFFATIDATISSVYQEVRLSADVGRMKLTVGGNYQRDKVDEDTRNSFISTNSGLGPFRYRDFINRANQKVTTWAAFAAADIELTDTLSAQLGVRYTDQQRDFDGCLVDAGDGALALGISLLPRLANRPSTPAPAGTCVTLDDATLATLPTVRDSLDENNLSWRAGLNWKPMAGTLIYANVTKGYKSGSYSPLPAVFASQLAPVTQESVLAYEAGFKTDLFGRVAQLSGAAFYYDYRNKQILGYKSFAGLGLNLPALQNIPRSSVRGGELEITLRPFSGLRITGGATYVDSQIDRTFIAPDPFGRIIDIKSEAFPSTPKWQLVGDAEYNFGLSDNLSAFIGGSASYRSATYAAFGENTTFKIKGYGLVDLRAGIEGANGTWRVQLWGKNIFNTYYPLNISHVVDAIARTVGMPATYGVTLTTRF